MTERLILFAKRPVEGKVKTRLAATLGDRRAVELYRGFLADQISFLGRFSPAIEIELCLDGEGPPPALGLAYPATLRLTAQGPGDLGARLMRAFVRSHGEGCRATVVIGADSPTLPQGLVEQAFALLQRDAPAVIAPASDGGYVLLGMREPHRELFDDLPWGQSTICELTRARAAAKRVEMRALEEWYDVDDPAGLARLERELAAPAAAQRAPATARLLASGGASPEL